MDDVTGFRWTRERIVLAAFVAVMLGSLPFLVHSWYDDSNDATVYLLTARSLADGEGYCIRGQPFHLRAPGLAVLLMPFLGGGEPNFVAINLMISLFGVATVVLFYFYARPRLGWISALAGAGLIWVLPGFQRLCNQPMSDVPGAAVLLTCLLLDRWSARSNSPARHVMLGVAVGLATYLRSAFVLLLPAIVLGRLLAPAPKAGRGARSLLPFAVVVVVIMIPWSIRNSVVERPPPPVDQNYQYSLSTLVLHEDIGDPASPRVGLGTVLSRIPVRAGELFSSLESLRIGRRAQPRNEPVAPARRVVSVLLLIALAIRLVRRREAGEMYVVANCLVVSVFPTQYLDRYTLPLLLISLPAAAELVRDGLARVSSAPVVRAVVPASLLLWAALEFEPRLGWEGIEERHLARARACELAASLVKPDDRLAAFHGLELTLFLDRTVYSLVAAIGRSGIDTGIKTIIDNYNVNSILIVEGGGISRGLRFSKPLAALLEERDPLAEEARSGKTYVRLFRIGPASEAR